MKKDFEYYLEQAQSYNEMPLMNGDKEVDTFYKQDNPDKRSLDQQKIQQDISDSFGIPDYDIIVEITNESSLKITINNSHKIQKDELIEVVNKAFADFSSLELMSYEVYNGSMFVEFKMT